MKTQRKGDKREISSSSRQQEDLYTIREVSRVFNLKESRLRYWAQTGFLNPSVRKGSRLYYTFSDLIGVRAAKELLESGLSLQKVRKNLSSLRKILPDEKRPLSRLRVRCDGDQMVVLGEDTTFEVETQQMLLDFRTGSLKDDLELLLSVGRPVRSSSPGGSTKSKKGSTPRETAYRWFVQGLSYEDREEEAALDAFRRALDLDPSLSAAHTNLGNIFYRRGKVADARAHYERALALDPDQPEARYNLANIHDDEGNLELAVAEYRRVVAESPSFPDAHFNLGLALIKVGSRVGAKDCFMRYLELDPDSNSVWSRLARNHIDLLDKEIES